jgi:3-oxoacyl-[acyl-carrier-protein] synthase-3
MKTEEAERIKITGTGMYVPEKVLTNKDLEKMVDTSDEWITTRTGIKERHIVAPDETTADMAVVAGKRAVEDAGLTIKDIDMILVATSSPDTIFPSTATWVQKGLKADHVPAFDLSAGCTGFLYGMIVAEGLILAGSAKRVLLIGAECLSKITNWKDRNTCVLFGDGGAAAVLEKSEDESGMLSSYWKADGNLGELLILPGGGILNLASHKTVDEGLHYIQMKGNEVFKYAVKCMGEAALMALKKAGIKKEDIDYLIPHQANIRIIQATGRRLKLPEEKVFSNIHKYGNMSVATIPIGLHELKEEGKLKKGADLVMVAFGAGFTWAAIVYKW